MSHTTLPLCHRLTAVVCVQQHQPLLPSETQHNQMSVVLQLLFFHEGRRRQFFAVRALRQARGGWAAAAVTAKAMDGCVISRISAGFARRAEFSVKVPCLLLLCNTAIAKLAWRCILSGWGQVKVTSCFEPGAHCSQEVFPHINSQLFKVANRRDATQRRRLSVAPGFHSSSGVVRSAPAGSAAPEHCGSGVT